MNSYSDFWLSFRDKIKILSFNGSRLEKLMLLKDYKRAVSNFAKIVTGKDIPVNFNSNDESYTDGESIVISGELHENSIDSTIGISLHESAHILLTDFNINLESDYSGTELTVMKGLLNWVEDRRIDNYMYSNCPGYRGYYIKMYNRYWNSDVISSALLNKEKNTGTIDDYIFHVYNMTNPNFDTTTLKGLDEIFKIVDLPNIKRLNSTNDSLKLALEIYEIIKKNCIREDAKYKNTRTSVNSGVSNGNDNGNCDSSQELENAIQKQIDFIDGNVEKENLSSDDIDIINILSNSNASLIPINVLKDGNMDFKPDDDNYDMHTYTVFVLDKINESIFNSALFPFKSDTGGCGINTINTGISMGIKLSKKLKTRAENKYIQYNRKETGKIERRLLFELGFGNHKIFEQSFIEKYNNIVLYISIDSSTSMKGNKFNESISMAVAIAKAATFIDNVRVVISLRGEYNTTEDCLPMIATIYDSKSDSFNKILKYFPRLYPIGGTPEGLCFSAIQNQIVASHNNSKSYFINLSDGEPAFDNYSGDMAAKHTAKQVNLMRCKNISILSYFIENKSKKNSVDLFKIMYGKDSKFISPDSIMEIANTLNEIFISDEQIIVEGI